MIFRDRNRILWGGGGLNSGVKIINVSLGNYKLAHKSCSLGCRAGCDCAAENIADEVRMLAFELKIRVWVRRMLFYFDFYAWLLNDMQLYMRSTAG